MKKIATTIRQFWHDERGASAGKYALIVGVVGAGIAGAGFMINGATADQLGPPCMNFTVEGC